ncbi:hypothetical protein C8R44DRAFT_859963 [Mycena epipterygia]|nr:hypothetical protein C8R44DRAFT_859963 [Mycena epipterygia]
MADASRFLNVPSQNDELPQKIIRSNELSLKTIKVTRFRENKRNKRSNEVTKMATTLGPAAWSPSKTESARPILLSRILRKLSNTREQPPLRVCAQIVLHSLSSPALPALVPGNMKLLREGNYILFTCREVLLCWRVAYDSLLGTYNIGHHGHGIYEFDTNVLHGGKSANIIMIMGTDASNTSFLVQVINWDFTTGVTESLSTAVKIISDVAVVPIDKEMYVIIDWRTQRYSLRLLWLWLPIGSPARRGDGTNPALLYRFYISLPGTAAANSPASNRIALTIYGSISYSGHINAFSRGSSRICAPDHFSAPIILETPKLLE